VNRFSLGYLTLVVAAFMIGLGNIWKFPALLLRYGLGGLIVYLVAVALIVPLIGVALESTKHKRYEVAEYYLKEYGKPAFALMFMVFNTLLLSYYSIVGGWTLSSGFVKGAQSGVSLASLIRTHTGATIATLVFVFVLLLAILIRGKEKTLDVMAASVVLFFVALILGIVGIFLNVPDRGVALSAFKDAFTWKGISLNMLRDMTMQAAYSLSLGMGFYLILGEFLPEKVSGTKIAAAGAVLDTVAALLGTALLSMVVSIDPTIPREGSSMYFNGLPHVLLDVLNMPSLLYLLSAAVFLAALSSMIPIGEPIVRIYAEFTRQPRTGAVVQGLGMAFVLGLINVLGVKLGVDTIGIMDGALTTFVLFGGIFAAWAVVEVRDYIPEGLRNVAYLGIALVGSLGVYSLFTMLRSGKYASALLLMTVIGLSLLLNDVLKKRLEGF